MATKTYMAAIGNDGNFAALVDGVDQAVASRADGWTSGKIASLNSSEFAAGTKQATGTFSPESTTAKPATLLTGTTANAFKLPAALSGTFVSGNWSFLLNFRATVVSAQQGRPHMKIFRSVNASGASATQVGATTGTGPTIALSSTADTVANPFLNPGAVTLSNEYLFFLLAWEVTIAGGSSTCDVVIRTGQASTGSRLVTPDFTAAGGAVDKKPRVLSSRVAAFRAALR